MINKNILQFKMLKNEIEFYKDITSWIISNKPTKNQLANQKVKFCKKYLLKKIPTDIEIYLNSNIRDSEKIKKFIETKPTRTGSGVAVVATMTKPSDCPHGSCIYCPGGIKSEFGDIPKSYTGKEPSTMRGIRNNFDPYHIIFNRLEQYIVMGQNPNKVDQIIMGGTFPSLSKSYQKNYILSSFKAYNDFSDCFYSYNKSSKKYSLNLNKFKDFFELPGDINNSQRSKRIHQKINILKNKNSSKEKKSLEYEQKRNETSAIRCIGITVETRPDYGDKKIGKWLLNLGATKIELGIQTNNDKTLKYINRGHTFSDSVKSISELRDLGFKLNFHIMPGLPTKSGKRTSIKEDINLFKGLFKSDDLKPDMLKIYPCMVMPGTKLENLYKINKFKPLNTEEAIEIISEGYKHIPKWCRVMRIQRDIPTYVTIAGVDKTNLRQYLDKKLEEKNIIPKEIRFHEIKKQEIIQKIDYNIMNYNANKGKEYFISAEINTNDEKNRKILGFLRLRFPNKILHTVIKKNSSIVRELHVYGTSIAFSQNKQKSKKNNAQHQGIGKKLINIAETISKENKKNKIIIISGVGVREYYKKLGYKKEGPYMTKKI
jgi:elongator complex protein 3